MPCASFASQTAGGKRNRPLGELGDAGGAGRGGLGDEPRGPLSVMLIEGTSRPTHLIRAAVAVENEVKLLEIGIRTALGESRPSLPLDRQTAPFGERPLGEGGNCVNSIH